MSEEQEQPKAKRGFATMTREERSAIARRGGKAAHAQGTAHKFTSEEARSAGIKGGNSLGNDRKHMAAIGRKGGKARGRAAAERAAAKGSEVAPAIGG